MKICMAFNHIPKRFNHIFDEAFNHKVIKFNLRVEANDVHVFYFHEEK